MKLFNAFAIVASVGLGGVAHAQAQAANTPTQTEPTDRKGAGSTDPSAASSLPQREATSMTVPEKTTAGNAEASSASSTHQRDAVSFTRGSDASATGLSAKWVSAIVGMPVETAAGARLGTVKDVIVDGDGHARYAIVSYGGVMGLGSRSVALPWESVGEMLQSDRLLVDERQLENAPRLAGAKPDSTDTTWRREAEGYWRGRVSLSRATAPGPATPDARAPASDSEAPERY